MGRDGGLGGLGLGGGNPSRVTAALSNLGYHDWVINVWTLTSISTLPAVDGFPNWSVSFSIGEIIPDSFRTA